MRFFHIADVHLGAQPDSGFSWSEDRAAEIWESFRGVVRRADEEEADLLLIAGDLFHRQPLMRELKELNYLFSTLKKTRVVFIAGNHDYLRKDSYYRNFVWNENVTFLEKETCTHVVFADLDTEVYGLSYHAREITEPKYDNLKPEKEAGCSILLAHGGDAKHIPFDSGKLLRSGFDYIALGHIHRPQAIAENRMAYAGALEPIDRSDTGVHGFIEGVYADGEIRTHFVPWAAREYVPLELTTRECPTNLAFQDTVRARIEEKGARHIYRVVLTGFRDPDIVYDTQACMGLGNVVSVEDASVPDYDFEKLLRAHKDDIVGRYIRTLCREDMSETERRALYYGIHALLAGK